MLAKKKQARKKKDLVMYAIRVPPAWRARTTKEARERGVSATGFVMGAVDLELGLVAHLRPHLDRIRIAGAALGIDPADEATILARLIEAGLDAVQGGAQ